MPVRRPALQVVDEEDELDYLPPKSQTTKNESKKKFNFPELDDQCMIEEIKPRMGSLISSTSERERIDAEYLKKRDPMKEFFMLTC